MYSIIKFYLYIYSSTLSNHPFDKPNFIPSWAPDGSEIWGDDITYTPVEIEHRYPIFQVPTFHQPPTPMLSHVFLHQKATGQTMSSITVARCLTMYGINVSCYTAILPTFPPRQFWRSLSSNKGTTSSKSVKHTCCPTAIVELVLGHHLFAFTQTKVHLVDGCVSRLWGNNIKNYSAPPKTLKHAIRMLTDLKLWEIRGFCRWSIFAFTHVSPVNDVMG